MAFRRCIKEGIKEQLSPQNMINCSFETSGCKGGSLTDSITYLKEYGAASEACVPYTGKT